MKMNAVKVKELPAETCFKKGVPYIMDSTFQNMILRRRASRLQVIVFLKLIKFIKLLYI